MSAKNKMLIISRADAAVRAIRACMELGIHTVAVYSEADRDCLHAKMANEAYCIGPAKSEQSYLNIPNILSVAVCIDGIAAIHPGWGFLSENPDFAKHCEDMGLIFVGPSSESIRKMGNKSIARKIAKKAGIPVIPGSKGTVKTLMGAKKIAREIGYPVFVKASAGGGGKGMRIARDEKELERMYHSAKEEAKKSFGNPAVYLEKCVERARHIEVQIIADKKGNIFHLGERDCSIQRRHQKLIEECPAPGVKKEILERIHESAIALAKYINYDSVGTVEFLFDEETGEFYFMEMNTRAQVEHGITEELVGIDIFQEQIIIAISGETDICSQEDINYFGHAIECRINAEDSKKGFMPRPGTCDYISLPGGPGVRVDTNLYPGYAISPNYDSLIAKVIVKARTRDESIRRSIRALEEFEIRSHDGLKTTIPFCLGILKDPSFVKGGVSTRYIDEKFGM